jgi:hypothetical protein
MKIKHILTFVVITIFFFMYFSVNAQTIVWQGKGRIVLSSDGNEHDHDDWAATPLSLAILSAMGLQNNVTLYTYSDHIWGSNQVHSTSTSGLNSYQHMRESALGAQKWFGFSNSRFICAVDNAEVAYNAIRDEINNSSVENPLIIVAAGPMQVVGEGINRADILKRQFVTLISHSNWNNMHSDRPDKQFWDIHTGWTFKEICDSFSSEAGGNLKYIQISDQNGGNDYDGLNAPIEKFEWIKTSEARNNPVYKPGAWDWLYSRLETCIKGKNFDASDAGMIVYLLTGIEKTEPEMARKIMENPVRQ